MAEFCDLHIHSTYSNLDGFGTPFQLAERAKSIGRKTLSLTDHGSVSGLVQLKKACEENSLKPIYGCEFYMVDSIESMYENKQRSKNHITVLASNLTGYRNLLKLSSDAYQKGFYYRPTIDKELLFEKQDGLIVFSGCWSGALQEKLKEGDIKGAEALAKEFQQVFGDRYYLETQHFPLFDATMDNFQMVSEKLDIPMVLTCDPHYQTEDQASYQEILHAIRDRREFDKEKIIYGAYQWPADELLEAVKELFPKMPWEKLFENVCAVADRCNVEMPLGGAPRFPKEHGETIEQIFLEKCKEGIKHRGLENGGQEYRDRFKKEYDLIVSKDFADYFMIVADMVKWAKDNSIFVGPARGSAAGSLICYLLGITEINPMDYGLIFERFIDATRFDLPDIDVDFEDERRDEVKQYMVNKYGHDRVCNVATFAAFKGRNSLDEIGKVFKIPAGDINTVKKYLVSRSGADMRVELTIADTFEMSPEAKAVGEKYPDLHYAEVFEGQLRHMSKHAAGLIVGDRPLDEIIALYEKDGQVLGSVEMKDASSLGLLKIDVLGIKELTILRNVCGMIGWTIEDLYAIPTDDPKTLAGFKNLDVSGVFQFDGDSTKSVLRQLPKLDFEQLTACVTLSKPGPAHCVSGKTLIYDCDSDEIISISKAYNRKIDKTLSLFPDGSVKPQKIKTILKNGKQKIYKLTMKNGRKIKATDEHWFLSGNDWKKLGEIEIGDNLTITNKKIWNRGTIGITKPNSGSFQKGEHRNSSTEFKKGHISWNKGIEWPEASERAFKNWDNGVYANNSAKYREWIEKNPEKHKAIRLMASKARSENLAKMTDIEKRESLQNFIEAGSTNGYGMWGYAEDGHRVESYWELAFDRFLNKNNIQHEMHPYIKNRRRADFKIKGIFIEIDGMERTQDYWNEKYFDGEPYVVILPTDDWKEKLSFAFESVENHDWLSIGESMVVGKECVGEEVVYDFEMEEIPNYLANGFVVHNSGGTTQYLSYARGDKSKGGFDWHPTLRKITESTYYQIIYQEQVLAIVREVGNMTFTDANKIRAFMAKSQGEGAFESFWPAFKKGAIENGFEEKDARKVWESIKTMGRWAFNKSHAVSYAMLAFWSMYMKQNHTLEFYAARLMKESDKDKRVRLLIEINKRNIPIKSPVLGKSKENWTIEGNGLRAGLLEVNSIGEKVATALVADNYRTVEDFKTKKNRGVTKRTLAGLEEINAFGDGIEDFFDIHKFDMLDKISPKRQVLFDIRDYDKQYSLQVAGIFKEMNYKDVHEEARSRGRSTDNIKNPDKAKYAMLLLEDDTDRCLINVDRYMFDKIGQRVWDAYNNGHYVVINGEKASGWRIVRCKQMKVYDANGVEVY